MRLVLVGFVVVVGTAHADPESDQPPPEDLVGWLAGGRVPPPLGTVGTLAVGTLHPWFMCALGLHGGLRVGRLSLIGEGELDVPFDNSGAVMVRGGADLRLALWRRRGPWSEWSENRRKQTKSQSRSSTDLFVEAGLGEEMISSSSLSITRPDLEVGGGIGFGSGTRSRDAQGRIGRPFDFEFYIRLRMLVARSPTDDQSSARRAMSGSVAPGGRDLGVFVDIGSVYGD
jgi:hypothetical protein